MMEGADGGLRGRIEYATALFDPATVERPADHLVRLLEQRGAPTRRPGCPTLAILDAAELRRGDPARAGHRRTPVTGTRARRLRGDRPPPTPDAPARDGAATPPRSYAELNADANRLAHRLRGHGAGPERLVGVCLDRGAELVPALLGVLKSGAAYLPLDPASPADRLDFMIDDAGARDRADHRPPTATGSPTSAATVVLLDDPDLVAELAAQPTIDPAVPRGRRTTSLRHLHLGLHRPAQGRRASPTPTCCACSTVTAGDYRVRPGRRVDAVPLVRLRLLGLGDLGRAAARRPAGRGAPRRVRPLARRTCSTSWSQRAGHRAQPDARRRSAAWSRWPADGDARSTGSPCGRSSSAARSWTSPTWRPGWPAAAWTRPQLINMYGITETTVHATLPPGRRRADLAGTGQPDRRAAAGPAPSTCSTPTAGRCRSACPARSTSAARASPAATSAAPS